MSGPITDFAGRVVVITGGASGIGKALGAAFVREGARVVLADVEKTALDATVAELSAGGATVVGVPTDVSDSDSVEALAAETYERFGATHVLFNNAGVGAPGAKAWDTTPNDFRWVLGVNVLGVAHGVQAFVPRMLAGGEPGHIVNTSSGDGTVNPVPSASVYAASKAAVSCYTECLAAQLAAEGAPLAVSLFLPAGKGLLDTGLWTADRNRPADLARERPRNTPVMTVSGLRELAAKGGQDLPVQPLDELADSVLAGLRAGDYGIMIGRERAGEILAERAARFGRGELPLVTDDHGGLFS